MSVGRQAVSEYCEARPRTPSVAEGENVSVSNPRNQKKYDPTSQVGFLIPQSPFIKGVLFNFHDC